MRRVSLKKHSYIYQGQMGLCHNNEINVIEFMVLSEDKYLEECQSVIKVK